DAPATYTATFLIEDEIVVDTSPAGLQLVVGGVTATAPYAFYCPRGASRTVEASSPQGTGGVRYTFASWSDGGARNHTIGCFAPANLTAAFGTEFQITLATFPVGLDVLLNGTTVTTPQSFWWPIGSAHGLDATTPQGTGGTRDVFLSWSDSGPRAHSVTATEPTSLTASFQVQYQLSVSTSRGAAFCDVVGCWYDAGGTATFAVDSTIVGGTPGTRYRFTGWAGDSTSTYSPGAILMNGPKSVTAEWQTEYLLTVESSYGTPTGGGWYAVDSTATASVESTASANGTTYRFAGWTGDATSASASFGVTMDGPKTVRATWESAPPPAPSNAFGEFLPWIAILAVVLVLIVLFLWRRRRKEGDETPTLSPPT
ncbi:MAG TPA: hypothetical protein VEM95_07845, partial [Thermoplasmata archaeon]|nr:hypothetical protein [Thermoplasmata archaeon]